MTAQETVQNMVDKARVAQSEVEKYSQEQIDQLVKAIAKAVFDEAIPLAEMAVEETRMGRVDHKIKKNLGKARILWSHLKGKKSVGIIRYIEEEGIVEVAKPMGVIGSITPTTNPIVTPMCNAMFAIKGRNAVIISPHPRAKKCSYRTVELMNEALEKLGAPQNLIQCIQEPSVELSSNVMKLTDVCISTGGMGMVKAAYSSGKPAFGVGVGNVQCILDRDIDLDKAVQSIIDGREFDHGIICSCEQTTITPQEDMDKVKALFTKYGAYVADKVDEVKKLRETLFPDGVMNKDCVGKSAYDVAKLAGIDVPQETRIIVVQPEQYGDLDLLSKEKMCPVISIYPYSEWDEAIKIAKENLEFEGKGHSVCIHSNNKEHIEAASLVLPVSRFLINQTCATSNGGSFANGLSATTTLGCGSWGNNSISENLSYKHLFNVSRIAYVKSNAHVPNDDELWGD